MLLLIAQLSSYTATKFHAVTALENFKPLQHLVAPQLRRAAEPGSEGGGHRNPLPPELGQIPHVAGKIFIPPAPRPRESPQIALPSGLEDMPQIATNMPIGIPTGVLGTQSPGPGRGRTIGTGEGNRQGPGTGHGPGDDPGPGYGGPRQRLSALPQLLWKIEPEYSEEARKARFQGSVMLTLEVDSEGHPRKIRVVRSLGLGLDERAIAAVAQWRFKPGLLNGRPVESPVSVEVSFRLL